MFTLLFDTGFTKAFLVSGLKRWSLKDRLIGVTSSGWSIRTDWSILVSATERELVCSRNDGFTMSGSFGYSKLTANVVKSPCKVAQVGPVERFRRNWLSISLSPIPRINLFK